MRPEEGDKEGVALRAAREFLVGTRALSAGMEGSADARFELLLARQEACFEGLIDAIPEPGQMGAEWLEELLAQVSATLADAERQRASLRDELHTLRRARMRSATSSTQEARFLSRRV